MTAKPLRPAETPIVTEMRVIPVAGHDSIRAARRTAIPAARLWQSFVVLRPCRLRQIWLPLTGAN